MSREDLRPLGMLAGATLVAFALAAGIPHGTDPRGHIDLPPPSIAFDAAGRVVLEANEAHAVVYTLDGSVPDAGSNRYRGAFLADPSPITDELAVIPTSMQWRHPIGTPPPVVVVRACALDGKGRAGLVASRSFITPRHPGLPVISISVPHGAFFDPDTGIYVVGNAIWDQSAEFTRHYPQDQKWWKYPGNFHYRGSDAERTAHMEMFAPDALPGAEPAWATDVRLRINGNNTRGFPQHALRVIFEKKLKAPVFGPEHGKGFGRLVLRSAGNDQDRAFMRDALQHRLCNGLPFETSACVQSVVYLDGAYWGLHELRERIDDREIARRYKLKAKDVTIIEDRLQLYSGDSIELNRFARFLSKAEHWNADGMAFLDSLDRYMDADAFLHYMAAQCVLANADWPDQNGKWWRHTGNPDTVSGPRDGRWRFIMGDSDQGMGLVVDAHYDMFKHIDRHAAAPLSRLLKACLRSPVSRERFRGLVLHMVKTVLSTERMSGEAQRMHDAIAVEMPDHIARWRRPLTMRAWENHVADLLTFARDRGSVVREQLDAWLPPEPPR